MGIKKEFDSVIKGVFLVACFAFVFSFSASASATASEVSERKPGEWKPQVKMSVPSSATGKITLEEASGNLPHIREKFVEERSKLPKETAAALSELFSSVGDLAVLKADMMLGIATSGEMGVSAELFEKRSAQVVERLKKATRPKQLDPLFMVLVNAALGQREFAKTSRIRPPVGRPPDTLPLTFFKENAGARMSEDLVEARKMVESFFPEEDPSNLQGMLDQLQAVDIFSNTWD